jgi:hypothetical protein
LSPRSYSGPSEENKFEHPIFWCESPADRTCMDVCVFAAKTLQDLYIDKVFMKELEPPSSRTWYTRSCCSRPCLVSL